jgi:hypothetical protein
MRFNERSRSNDRMRKLRFVQQTAACCCKGNGSVVHKPLRTKLVLDGIGAPYRLPLEVAEKARLRPSFVAASSSSA